MEERLYPAGMQSFEMIRERGFIYIDKTELIYKMASRGQNYFLSRPRRFGKSLLVSTMKAYFEGRKELFKGLAIEKLEQDWTAYPVLHIDMSNGKYYSLDTAMEVFDGILSRMEEQYGIPNRQGSLGGRLSDLIIKAHAQTGQKVVVLIDEYDAPMLDSIDNQTLQAQIRDRVRDLFSPLKALAQYLRFVFLTGISKFSQLSIFSELNNLTNISMQPQFEAICGITEEELLTQMRPDIEMLGSAIGMGFDATLERLKQNFDGYHFSTQMTDIYNPYSLLCTFFGQMFDSYWFATGTPTFLLNLLREKEREFSDLEAVETTRESFNQSTDSINDPIPVLYQSGYLTIKGYDPDTDTYTLGFPNQEVRTGFARSLSDYLAPQYTYSRNTLRNAYLQFRKNDDVALFIDALKTYFAGFPFEIINPNEHHYHSLLYTLFVGFDADVQAEVSSAQGRADIILKMPKTIYVIEVKYDRSADAALRQIKEKGYALPYIHDGRRVVMLGLNFSSSERNISDWKTLGQ